MAASRSLILATPQTSFALAHARMHQVLSAALTGAPDTIRLYSISRSRTLHRRWQRSLALAGHMTEALQVYHEKTSSPIGPLY